MNIKIRDSHENKITSKFSTYTVCKQLYAAGIEPFLTVIWNINLLQTDVWATMKATCTIQAIVIPIFERNDFVSQSIHNELVVKKSNFL